MSAAPNGELTQFHSQRYDKLDSALGSKPSTNILNPAP